MGDWSAFYIGMAIVGAIGILAAIFSGPIGREIQRVEEKSNGRVSH